MVFLFSFSSLSCLFLGESGDETTSQAVKEQDQIPNEIIDITKVQIESISEYFTTEAFKLVMNKGL